MTSDNPTEYFLNLHNLLDACFNASELVELCDNLGIDHENIGALTPKRTFTHKLINYYHRRGQLNELVETCVKLRPGIEWPKNIPPLVSQTFSIPILASLALRAVALMVDGIIAFVLFAVLVHLPLRPYLPDTDEPLIEALTQNRLLIIHSGSIIVIPWLYSALLEASNWQATVGKKLFGLKVTDDNGRRVRLIRSFLRSGIKVLSLSLVGFCPYCLVLLLTGLLVALTDNKQAIHDKIAKTLVFKV